MRGVYRGADVNCVGAPNHVLMTVVRICSTFSRNELMLGVSLIR